MESQRGMFVQQTFFARYIGVRLLFDDKIYHALGVVDNQNPVSVFSRVENTIGAIPIKDALSALGLDT